MCLQSSTKTALSECARDSWGVWVQPYATDAVSLGSAEEPYDSDMTHSYRLTEGRLIRYPMIQAAASILATSLEVTRASIPLSESLQLGRLASEAASTSSPLRSSLK